MGVSRGRTLALLLLLLAAAAGVRLEAARRAGPIALVGDEVYYTQVALSLARGEGHASPNGRALRPPAFPWLLSRTIAAADARDPAVAPDVLGRFLALQVVLGTLLVGVTFALARAWLGAPTGWLAGGLAAVEPGLVGYSQFLWSETLFAPLVGFGLLSAVSAQRRGSLSRAALAGALLGAAALTREVAIPVAGVAAGWGVWASRGGERWRAALGTAPVRAAAARGALLLAVAAAVVLPWTWRNHAVLGAFVPVGTIGWYAMAEGNLLAPGDWWAPLPMRARAFRAAYFALPDEIERTRLARRTALTAIAAEQPGWLVKKALRNVSLLFQPDSFLAKKIARGAYGLPPPGGAQLALALTVASSAALLGLGWLGFLTAPGRDERWLVAGVLAVVVALHVVANSATRFRMPWMPLVIAYAAWALLHAREVRARLVGWRAAAAVAALVFYAAVCLPHFAHHSQTARVWSGAAAPAGPGE